MRTFAIAVAAAVLTASMPAAAQQAPPPGVRVLAPSGAIKPTGTWGLASRAGDFLFIAGTGHRRSSTCRDGPIAVVFAAGERCFGPAE